MTKALIALLILGGAALAQPPSEIPTGLSGSAYQSAVNAWLQYLYTRAAPSANPTFTGTVVVEGQVQGDPNKNGAEYLQGFTSGGLAFSVMNIAGTPVTLLWPDDSSDATDGKALTIGSAITCPTKLPDWAPATCRPLSWAAPAPAAHAATHASDGSDPLTLVISQITDLQNTLDGKAELNLLDGKADVGASTTVNGQVCALGSTCTVADATKVPTTRTVNGHALSADVTVSKSDVGLGSVDNTNDAGKPVSTATQAALDAKAPLASPSFTGAVSIGGTVLKGGGTSLPATCTVGDQYFLTTGTTGNYQCTATNTWTLPGGGGGIDRYWAPQTIGVVPSSPLSLPSANYPAVDSVIGTNIVYGVWSFASGSDQSVYGSLPIPTSVPSSIVFEVRWRTADTTTSHTVSLQALYLCNATGADSAMTSAGTASGNPPSSQYQWTTSTITLSSPSCSAGDTMFFKIVNKGGTATATSNIEVASIRIRG